MDEEAETKSLKKWLRVVDEPLETKEGDKRAQRQEMNEDMPIIGSFYAADFAELRSQD